MARKKGFRIPGVSFSLNRALGITYVKQKIARATGIPTTKEGRRRKFGPLGSYLIEGAIVSGLKVLETTPESQSPPQRRRRDPSQSALAVLDAEQAELPFVEAEPVSDESEDTVFGCAVIFLIYFIGVLCGSIITVVAMRMYGAG